MVEPENVVLRLLKEMRERFDRLDAKVDALATNSALDNLGGDVASDLMTAEKRASEQIVGLRRAVVEYHSAVVGHGIEISELEARVQRLESSP